MSYHPRSPEVLFQAPGLSAGSPRPYSTTQYTDYDPYTSSYSSSPAGTSFQDVPLLQPNRGSAGPLSPLAPQLLRSGSNRTGKRPTFLTLATSRSSSGREPEDQPFNPGLLYHTTNEHPPNTGATDDSLFKTPSPGLLPDRIFSRPIKQHPFLDGFEPPEWRYILLHLGLCILAYPILLLAVYIAKEKVLFWTRFVVGIGCGIVGFVLGLSLTHLGKSFLEAATWATILHQSKMPQAPGVPLSDLEATSQDPHSAWPGIRLLWNRMMYPGTARRQRRMYDKRPWSLVVVFFLLMIAVSTCLPFIMGRLILIDTRIKHQRQHYTEVAVKGDLSTSDLERAADLAETFAAFTLTWTLSPFSTHGSLPAALSFQWDDDKVYFSETSRSQFQPNGSGFGTFDTDTTGPSIVLDSQESESTMSLEVEPGSLIRFPRWGIRIHCEKLPDGNRNIIPRSETQFTYLFTPRETLRSLFSSFNMDFPDILEASLNLTTVMQPNDTLPDTVDVDGSALGAAFYDNGVAHSFKSVPLTMGAEGYGWTTIESVIVRLNTTYTPNGTFPIYGADVVTTPEGQESRIGYDAAVCLQLYEPYVMETYNITGSLPSTTKIVSKGKTIIDVEEDGQPETIIGPRLEGEDVKRELNSTGYAGAYETLHGNSVNQMLKDNGRDAFYVPSPTVVSFTSGQGPYGYTELSAEYFAQARALADASNVLPYFAGSADTLARRYADSAVSSARIDTVPMLGLLGLVLGMGLIAGLFVPRLPLGVPRRGFDLYSWIVAFYADGLVSDTDKARIHKAMELKDIEMRMGEAKFRYSL